MGTLDARLIALDADNGAPCAGFGAGGQVDLTRGVDLRDLGNYQMTSAPAVSGDVVVVGSSIGDNRAVDVERGIVRGFDARSGALRWTWDPIPWASQTTPRTGAGNAWSTLSVDAERGLVFVPTGSASPDHWGGTRKGDNRWANSVVALRADTGLMVWGFQVVHHDLWDYDVASQPTLFAWRDGTPAIAITTKMGRVFVLDRTTGAPLVPVEERPAPPSDVPGEEAWPTQPSSGISLGPEGLRAEEAWGATEKDRAWCRDKIAAARSEGIFTPPSVRGTVVFPGYAGGVNWGSAAYDPTRHLLFVNTNRLPMVVRLIPHERLALEATQGTPEERLRAELALQAGTPYAMRRAPLLSPSGTPCNPPPWGTLVAVDLFSGRKVWDVPLGSVLSGDLKRLMVRLFRPALLDGQPELRRPHRHRRRPRVHRGLDGQLPARVRFGHRARALEVRATRGRAGHPDDVPRRRASIPGDRSGRARQARHQARRLRGCLHVALRYPDSDETRPALPVLGGSPDGGTARPAEPARSHLHRRPPLAGQLRRRPGSERPAPARRRRRARQGPGDPARPARHAPPDPGARRLRLHGSRLRVPYARPTRPPRPLRLTESEAQSQPERRRAHHARTATRRPP
jgi:outer membrane protein assembly factor BamB